MFPPYSFCKMRIQQHTIYTIPLNIAYQSAERYLFLLKPNHHECLRSFHWFKIHVLKLYYQVIVTKCIRPSYTTKDTFVVPQHLWFLAIFSNNDQYIYITMKHFLLDQDHIFPKHTVSNSRFCVPTKSVSVSTLWIITELWQVDQWI